MRKILKAVTISGSASSNPIYRYCDGQLFQKFKYENVIKIKNKPDPALLGGSYLFHEIKKRTLKSRETIPLNKRINFMPIKKFFSALSTQIRLRKIQFTFITNYLFTRKKIFSVFYLSISLKTFSKIQCIFTERNRKKQTLIFIMDRFKKTIINLNR
jgi:hypothetical protein